MAKYEKARKILGELICIGYPIFAISLMDEEWNGYEDEYIISLNKDGLWCEPFKREDNYIVDESDAVYLACDCNSKVIKYLDSNEVFEFKLLAENEFEESYNCECEGDCKNCVADKSNTDSFNVTVKVNIDDSDALKVIKDIERRMIYTQSLFDNIFRI